MEGFFRPPRPISDARPPAPPPPAPRVEAPRCARCAEPLSADQSVEREGRREHVICEPAVVADLARRLEASRALHRAFGTLGAIPALREHVERARREVGDVADADEALAVLARLRTAVEVTQLARQEQRRLALSLLDRLGDRLRTA